MRQKIFMMIIHYTYVAKIFQCFEPERLPYVFVKEHHMELKKTINLFCLRDVIFYVKQLWKIEEIEEIFEGWGQGNYFDFGGNCKNVINTCIERLTLVCTLTLYLAYCIMLFNQAIEYD